jgi:hypothetical protein
MGEIGAGFSAFQWAACPASSPGLFIFIRHLCGGFFRVYYNTSGRQRQLFLFIPKNMQKQNKSAISKTDKRFVIQEHMTHSDVHWDFMLEWEACQNLQTYRLDKAPQQILCSPANAVKIFDHSPRFLTYQGQVNKGRGSIRIVEAGTYQLIRSEHNHIELNLAGQVLKGKFTLCHVKDDKWQFGVANAN